MNKVILMWTIGKDIELMNTANNLTIAKTSLATSERIKKWDNYEERTTWHNIVAFWHTANFLNKYFEKWSKILLEWKISNTSWEKDDWTKWYKSEIIADKLEFAWFLKQKDEFIESDKKHLETEEISIEDLSF